MATLCSMLCSVCEIQHKNKEAEYWCSECEQGLCPECLNCHNALKSSRNHEVITVENYKQLPSSISSIQHHCSDHNRKFQMYCPQHENLCCPLCISSNHRNCVGLLSIEEVIATSKTSSLLDSMEQRIKDLLTNAEEIIDDRKQNLTSIQNQHHKFQSEITQMRDQINKHLDFLEKQSTEELLATKKDVSSRIETVITNITQNYKHVSKLKNEMCSIRKYASNLQTFLGAKVLEVEIQKKEEYLQSLSIDGSLEQVVINLEVDDELSNILSIQKFGSVSTEKKSPLFVLKNKTERQAQILRTPVVTPSSIHDINPTQQQIIAVPEKITGCSMTPSGKKLWDFKDESVLKSSCGVTADKHSNIYVADYENSSIVVISPDGKKGRRILGEGVTGIVFRKTLRLRLSPLLSVKRINKF
ncbi:protein wech-like [Mytilus trossulus]|uniref:protein wech-like n=1 Tax=Mytilus trossulus TaxID=6551 RepID=UPI003004F09A